MFVVMLVIEKLVVNGICSCTNNVIDLSSYQLRRHIGVKVTSSRRHTANGLSKTFDNSVVDMVTDL